MIVLKEANYTQYIHYNIPKYWVVHNTTFGYINRDGWVKAMVHFNTVCGTNKINTQLLFYDGHDSHFGDRDIHIIHSHQIKPFVLKVVD